MRKSQFKNLVLILFLLAGLVSVATPFLHNHAPAVHEPGNCPAFIVETIFSAAIVAVSFAFLFLLQLQRIFLTKWPVQASVFLTSRLTRAPPTFSF